MCRRPAGFSLIELMVVVAIVGILAAIAYPSYTQYRLRSERAEGQRCLLESIKRAESFYTRAGRYPKSMSEIYGVGANQYDCGSEALYQLAVREASDDCLPSHCIAMIAVSTGRQAKDGDLLIEYDFRTRTMRKQRIVNGTIKPWTSA